MKQPSRRKLLRGTLSAPLVLTVASPSALAATSFQACIARVADQPQPSASIRLVTTQDQWLRTEVRMFSGQTSTSGGWKTFYLAPDNFYYRTDDVSCTKVAQTDFNGMNNPRELTQKMWALVYIDETGRTVGYGVCPNSGYAVTRSCWMSFNMPA